MDEDLKQLRQIEKIQNRRRELELEHKRKMGCLLIFALFLSMWFILAFIETYV